MSEYKFDGFEELKKFKAHRLQKLKDAIDNNEQPIIENCSFNSDKSVYTWGDLEQLGLSGRSYTHNKQGEVEEIRRSYRGSNPIRLKTWGLDGLTLVYPNSEHVTLN